MSFSECAGECEQCDGRTNDDCSSCDAGARPLSDASSSCRSSEPAGYFDGGTEWTKCHAHCEVCTGASALECYVCVDGLFLHPLSSSCEASAPGYFADPSDKVLKPCHEIANGCLACSGTAPLLCTACDNSVQRYLGPDGTCTDCPLASLLDAQGNCRECTVLGYEYAQAGGECAEVRGDGLNMGNHECDDGNLTDGDGCSAEGAVEPGYTCAGGSPSSPDSCSLPPFQSRVSFDPSSYALRV